MKKLLLSLFAVLTASFAMAGDGTKENPFTVADVLAAKMDSSWVYVKAYIVGSCTGSTISSAEFGASDKASASNIILADSQSETSTANIIPVQLPTGNGIREGLALKNVPENLGKTVLLKGQLIKYFGQNGIKNITNEYELSGEGVTPTPAGDDFEAALTDAQGNWTFEDVVIPEDLSYIWSQSSTYGMKASAFANSTKYVSDSYLVSPAIVLQENSVLTFDHAWRYGAEDIATQLTLWVREADATEKTQVTIPNYSDGTSWSYVSSGEIDLSAYAGKTIQLCFRYTSNEDYAATWEIKNVKVTNAKAAEEGPVLKDPTNTPETAYSVSEAINIINNKSDYDMSKKVYTKGVITGIKSIDVSQYVRAQYYIGETVDAETTLYVYNGYYLNGKDFTDNEQIKVGDEVIIYGMLTLYNTTPEIDQNNYIYSLNGETPVQSISADVRKEQVIFDLSGRRVEKAVKGVYIVNGKKVVF